MSDIKRTLIKSSCNCSRQQFILQIGFPFEKDHLQLFTADGFIQSGSYTKLGIVYLEDLNLITTGSFGSNRLQIKCKNDKCNDSLEKLETIIKSIK